MSAAHRLVSTGVERVCDFAATACSRHTHCNNHWLRLFAGTMSKRASEATGGGAAPPPPPPEAMAAFFSMFDAVTGHILPSCVHAAAKLGIADAIGDDTLTLRQLASKLSVTHTEGLFRLMRFLIAHGIFAEEQTPGAAEDGAGDKSVDEERGYKNNTKSSFLRENAPMSLWGMARHMRDGAPTWTCLPGFLIKGADAEGASPFGMYYGEVGFAQIGSCSTSFALHLPVMLLIG